MASQTLVVEERGEIAPPAANYGSVELALFRDDALVRFLARIGLARAGRPRWPAYATLLPLLCWLPMVALNALWLSSTAPARARVLFDLAAFAQLFIAMPMLLLGEAIVDRRVSSVGHYLSRSGIAPDVAALDNDFRWLTRWRTRCIGDVLCLAAAYLTALAFVWNELSAQPSVVTWRTVMTSSGSLRLSAAGWWFALVALPLFTYVWLRWVWKVALWTGFLRRISRIDLRLNAAHPDQAGGLAFLGEMQSRFGILIFGFGIMIAATVTHKVLIEGVPMSAFNTWTMVAGYVCIAPMLFLLPMLLFTRKLVAVKHAGMARYSSFAIETLSSFERAPAGHVQPAENGPPVQAPPMQDLAICFENAHNMRTFPADLKSILQLFATALGPMLPILLKFVPLPAQVKEIIEFLK